ncbi:MAG: CRISPR-associated protein Cst2 [Thermosediminibacterales bacterium]|nr:CRISPR-associated protein Cst2 [Thermosediminibacterales bacterium]
MKAKGITVTVVFESSSVNRDEKLGGNITSIKKLSRFNGTYSFMSRAFIRHNMYSTLNRLFEWKPAPVKISTENKKNKKGVIQFSFPEGNIITYPELDLFGYMSTSPDTVTRKAPLGITKAISLEPWQGDMAFYANHDMVKRAREQGLTAGKKEEEPTPDPYSKEEHYSYYKVSFTLDLMRLGLHDLYFKKLPKELEEWCNKLSETVVKDVKEKVVWKEKVTEGFKWYKISEAEKVLGFVGKKEEKQVATVRFLVAVEEYKRRVKEVLTVIKDGLTMHSSTEDYGMVPVFIAVAALKVPVPVFNSAITIKDGGINAVPINKAAENSHIIKTWYWYNNTLPLIGTLDDKLNEWAGVEEIIEAIGLKTD